MHALAANNIISEADTKLLSAKHSGDAFAILQHLVKGQTPARRDRLGKLWGDSLGVAYFTLAKTIFQNNVVKLLPEEFARLHKIIPLFQFGNAITLAASDPSNGLVIGEAKRILGKEISPVFSFPEDIEDAIAIQYQSKGHLDEMVKKLAARALPQSPGRITQEQLKQLAGDDAIIQFVHGLCLLALKERASDIHIEPAEDAIRVRFRIDGFLHERFMLESALLPPLVTRLKVLARLDITERRRPQDGRITIPLSNRSIDVRFSSVPTIYGEKIVLRILGEVGLKDIPSLKELYLSKSALKMIMRLIEEPNGVFFVTGPTGCGKTTTLYTAIKHINKPGINIMTIEDPVEIRLPGLNQVQVNPDINFTFAMGLRAFLRQDPDVILLGEIRDAETAEIAAQAALTGHLVLTTMHTNSAIQAITRLMEIGVEAFLVAPSIIGTMSQRLVRQLCHNCKEQYRLSKQETDTYFINYDSQPVYFYRARGCEQCLYTGYYGRIPIQEIFIINDEVRQLIARNASSLEIAKCAKKSGFVSMRYDGIKKVLRGLTTIEEIDRVTIAEDNV